MANDDNRNLFCAGPAMQRARCHGVALLPVPELSSMI
jgi:hypothetical protein